MRSKRRPLHVLILLAYTLFALVLTWPVVTRLDSHVPGNGADDPPLTWNLWWVPHALLTLQTEGKKPLSALEFLRGRPLAPGTTLGF